jgi:sarcosine oxidase subunit beta
MQHFEVIVVGAGIAGTSTAFFLRERGVKTALIEKSHPAGGPTGKSSALTHAFYLMPELSQLAIRGSQILRDIPQLTGEGPVHTAIGMMWVCGRDAKEDWSKAAHRIVNEGSRMLELTPAELGRQYPDMDLEGVELGLWEPDYGYADPYGATNALERGARQRGAVSFMSSSVDKIAVNGARVAGVELADGRTLSADAVVVAAGPWTKALISALGYELPIFAERHEMAVLEAGGRALEYMPFSWCDDLLSSYARPDGNRVVLAGLWAGGGTGIRSPKAQRPEVVTDLEHFRDSMTEDEVVAILSQLVPRFPKLAELGLRPGYAALYDMSPDDNPLIGPIPGIDGLYVICGSSGHGFKMGAGVGEQVARLVATRDAPLLAPFKPDRFAHPKAAL